jgi:hypothetical protein
VQVIERLKGRAACKYPFQAAELSSDYFGTGRRKRVDSRQPCRSLNSVFFSECAPIPSDHPHFLPTQPSVLDCHAEECVFVLLVVGSKGILVQKYKLRVIRARFCELRKRLPDGSDQIGLSLHAFVVGHRFLCLVVPVVLLDFFARSGISRRAAPL